MHEYHGYVTMPADIGVGDCIDDVITLKDI